MVNYGESLKEQRLVRGITLREIEDKTGISNGNLSRWERGEVIPNVDFCVRLANFYGISVDELLGLDFNFQSETTKNPGLQLSSEERKLIKRYRALSAAYKKYLNQTIEILSDTPEGQKKVKRG